MVVSDACPEACAYWWFQAFIRSCVSFDYIDVVNVFVVTVFKISKMVDQPPLLLKQRLCVMLGRLGKHAELSAANLRALGWKS